MKTCNKCRMEKPLEKFSGNKDSKDGKHSYCKSCQLETNRLWRAERKLKLDPDRADINAPRTCSVCKEEKLGRDFYFDKASTSGFQTLCKDCTRKNTARWQKQGRYNLEPGEYEQMVIDQGNKCGICETGTPGIGPTGKPCRWIIDHDHETDEVRGLLCHACNKGIGLLRDDPIILQAAIDWLQRVRTR